MDELKPCPFCGGDIQDDKVGFCYCPKQYCPGNIEAILYQRWNTRPLEDALRAEVEKWKEAEAEEAEAYADANKERIALRAEVEKWKNHANDNHALFLAASAKLAVAMEALENIYTRENDFTKAVLIKIAVEALDEIAKMDGGK